ncbi:hypothetical protein NDU88_008406 [Pleurodeles waltl]|uniref:Uncharacterized protein n=1 Tax=Pleurodeles waltl TaxID=8319 RepID=A0AAV7P4X5_PLEWA|nr:hypothetical protein NDU88_008389 [Pleurodeles waltl]KAJ1120232.1 hypothetical protein NDU88_008406 [Pleurodeles waltl]
MRLLSAGPRAPLPGARESGYSEGDSVRGAGAIREVGAPSRGAHLEPITGEKKGGGSRGPKRPPIWLPQSPLHSRPLAPQSGGAAVASTPSAHTTEAGARGEQPAPGLLAFLRSPGPGSSQTRLK